MKAKDNAICQKAIQEFGLPVWEPGMDVSALPLISDGGFLDAAKSIDKSIGTVMAAAGYPIIKMRNPQLDQPFKMNDQEFRLEEKGYTLLAGDENGWDGLVQIVASSDAPDLDADVMALSALKQIANQSVGLPIYLNHRYVVPDDLVGYCQKSKIIRKEVWHPLLQKSATFNLVVLGIKAVEQRHNDRGYRTAELIRDGFPVPASVTVLAKNVEQGKELRNITDVITLETSIVGIPANLTAYPANAKSVMETRVWAEMPKSAKSFIFVPASYDAGEANQLVAKAAAAAAPANQTEDIIMSTPVVADASAQAVPAQAVSVQAEAAPVAKAAVELPEALRKGAFVDAYAAETSSIYFLTEIFRSAWYRIYYQREGWHGEQTSADEAVAELATALDEFKAKVMEKLEPKLRGDEAKSASADVSFDAEAFLAKSAFVDPVGLLPLVPAALQKAGARHSAADMKMVQEIHDATVSLDAKCATEKMEKSAEVAETAPAVPVVDVDALQAAHVAEVAQLREEIGKSLKLAAQAADTAEQATTALEAERVETKKWKTLSQMATAVCEQYAQAPASAD